jgi:hypothetical protein
MIRGIRLPTCKDDMPRYFRYSGSSRKKLSENRRHAFAQRYALNIYGSNAIYTFIPKNASSTMRLTLACANGCIDDASGIEWIHANYTTFSASLADLARAQYTFVILRCPYARIASTFLDKIVSRARPADIFLGVVEDGLAWEQITFRSFIRALTVIEVRKANVHWRPQVDFLVYRDYDDWFCVENMDLATRTLKQKIDLEVLDARALTRHGVEGLTLVADKDYSDAGAAEILDMKNRGICPHPKSLFSDDVLPEFRKVYRRDINLYAKQFGESSLLFPARG